MIDYFLDLLSHCPGLDLVLICRLSMNCALEMYPPKIVSIIFPGIWSIPGLGDAPRFNTGSKRLSTHRHVCVQRTYHVHYGGCYHLGKHRPVPICYVFLFKILQDGTELFSLVLFRLFTSILFSKG